MVRHGETDWNRIRRLQGHTDIALNARGIEQAARLAEALALEPIASVHSSDLARAMATAGPLATALDVDVITHADLRERNYGVLEGLTFDEMQERHPDDALRLASRDSRWSFGSGESQEAFHGRVVDAVERIARSAARAVDQSDTRRAILIVTHGGVLDMLYRAALGLPLDAERACPVPNAAINRLSWDESRPARFEIVEWATVV